MKATKSFFMFLTYAWLRCDLGLRLAFGKNWQPRYDFMSTIFGEKETEEFLAKRAIKVKKRSQKPPPIILPSHIDKKTHEFLKQKVSTKAGKTKRKQILEELVFWATDPKINQFNTESYKTRSEIIDSFLNTIFQNSLKSEADYIFSALQKIVFSRITYLGAKGEPSPIVHDIIISSVGRLLSLHLSELVRLRDEKLEKLTKIKLIKEIKKADKDRGSLAFSGEFKENEEFKQKFPLPDEHAKLLIKIINHYRFSAWPE